MCLAAGSRNNRLANPGGRPLATLKTGRSSGRHTLGVFSSGMHQIFYISFIFCTDQYTGSVLPAAEGNGRLTSVRLVASLV